MRPSPTTLALIASGCLLASGGCGNGHSFVSRPSGRHHDSAVSTHVEDAADGDPDGAAGRDDYVVYEYGHPAGAAEWRAVAAAVQRYYRAAARADGARVCAMLTENVAEAIPEEYGAGSSASAVRSRTCPAIVAALFRPLHARFAVDATFLKVTAVRIEGNVALGVFRFHGAEPRRLALRREAGAWKIKALLDSGIP